MKLLALAMLGGAIGSGTRYLVNLGVARVLGPGFPWGILLINVTGSLAMGLLAGLLATREFEVTDLRTFLATGFLGGYTTFSAFSLDFANLVRSGEPLAAAAYVLASVALSLAGVFAGLWLARVVAA
jgi:CrcB protein